jgi:hypothetical protein
MPNLNVFTFLFISTKGDQDKIGKFFYKWVLHGKCWKHPSGKISYILQFNPCFQIPESKSAAKRYIGTSVDIQRISPRFFPKHRQRAILKNIHWAKNQIASNLCPSIHKFLTFFQLETVPGNSKTFWGHIRPSRSRLIVNGHFMVECGFRRRRCSPWPLVPGFWTRTA